MMSGGGGGGDGGGEGKGGRGGRGCEVGHAVWPYHWRGVCVSVKRVFRRILPQLVCVQRSLGKIHGT